MKYIFNSLENFLGNGINAADLNAFAMAMINPWKEIGRAVDWKEPIIVVPNPNKVPELSLS